MKFKVIATGGTIGSETKKNGISTRDVAEKIIDVVIKERPLKTTNTNIEFDISYPLNLLSENFVPNDWGILAREIVAASAKKYNAIVVTHGTDSMAYSIAAISLMMPNVRIPIVFTGALKNFDDKDSDAPINLWNSITFAEHQVKEKTHGVYLVFQGHDRNGFAYWGPRVQSIKHGGKYFNTIDNNKIARVVNGEVKDYKFYFSKYKKTRYTESNIITKFDDRIEVHKIYPGFNPKFLESAIERKTKAILLDLYHSGTACSRAEENNNYSILSSIELLKKENIAVLGSGAPLRSNEQYQSLTNLIESGMIPLGFISLEFAIVKTMFLLGKGYFGKDLGKQMENPFVNEIYSGTY